MCGICGVIHWESPGGAATGETEVTAMIERLVHRGPDGCGIANAGPGTLGAARLAIRGIADGQQPIVDEASGVVAVCNGEIDNHGELKNWLASRGRPVSASTDIAVIPGLYLELGSAFVERLVGAFAIGLWSPREELLLLARDRAGERPLHFAASNGVVRFASEVSALAGATPDSLTVDTEAISAYLQAGYLPAPASPFREIRKVSPGEIVEFRPGGAQSHRYWQWDVTNASKAAPQLEEFDSVFREAVGLQSDVDVPLGLFLSGGVDSSLIAAVVRQLRPQQQIPAYTLRFSEASYDESNFAEQVAKTLGLELNRVDVAPEAFPAAIADLVATSGEPLADPAWVPTALLSQRAAQDVKIALVGEGADELFGGYPTYIGAEVHGWYSRLPAAVRAMVRWGADRWPATEKKVTLSFLMKKFVQGAELDGVARHLLWTSSISPVILARLGIPVTEMRRFEPQTQGQPLLDVLQKIDLENSLGEGLLTKADRASMRYPLELRAPFLDQRVMEFAARLPASERVRGVQTKIFLKRFARRYLPSSIVDRRKRGLSVPLARWLRGPLHDWAAAQLGSATLAATGIRTEAAVELLKEHQQRKADHARALWTLLVLSEWLAWAARQNASSDGSQGHLTSIRSASA